MTNTSQIIVHCPTCKKTVEFESRAAEKAGYQDPDFPWDCPSCSIRKEPAERKPKSLPHIVLLNSDKVKEAARKMRKYKTGNTDFRNYVFLTSFYRNECNVKNVGHGNLGRRIGVHPRYIRPSLARLEGHELIRRFRDKKSEKTMVDWIMVAEDKGDKVVQLRVGPKQYKRWRQIGPALRTLLILATFADSINLIDTQGLALAELIRREVGVSLGTANRHVKVLKEARILHGVNDCSGLKTNQHLWFIDDFMIRIQEKPNVPETS